MNAVDRHPQRQQIIEAIVGGQALRQITATLNPQVHHSTLARYRLRLLGKTTATMRGKSDNVRALRELAAVAGVGKNPEKAMEGVKTLIRQELDEATELERSRYKRWISDAESTQHVDPDTGEVRHNMDHAALARHARNALSAIELRAKLNGVLQDAAGSTQVNVNAVVVMPSHAPESRDDGPVIDIDVVR